MSNIVYEFEEISVAIGADIQLISGSVSVDYIMLPAEPDVGISHDYPEITQYGPMTYRVLDDDGELGEAVTLNLDDGLLYAIIFSAIEGDVLDACCLDGD